MQKGQTAVHLAAKEGQLDVLQELYRMLVPSSDDDDRPDMERLFVATDKVFSRMCVMILIDSAIPLSFRKAGMFSIMLVLKGIRLC